MHQTKPKKSVYKEEHYSQYTTFIVGRKAASMATWCDLETELYNVKKVPSMCLNLESDSVIGLYLRIAINMKTDDGQTTIHTKLITTETKAWDC